VKHGWLWLVAGLVTLEAGVFYLRHDDVVALSRSADSLASDPTFARTARTVLEREQITRRVLERIADAASRQQDRALQLAALDRIAALVPADRDVQLRRADVLRAMGRLNEAEILYARLTASSAGDRP